MSLNDLNGLAINADDAANALYLLLESFDLPPHQERPALFVAGALCGRVGELVKGIAARHEKELAGPGTAGA